MNTMDRMKKAFRALMTVVIALMIACTSLVQAKAADAAGGTCGSGVKWTLSDEGAMTISGSGAMTDYGDPHESTATAPWYEKRGTIRSVTIADGVTNIGNYAFSDCQNLNRISIASTVTRIGEGAFELCDVLASVNVPTGVTVIENGAFSACTNLGNISLPGGLVKIGDYAFSVCENLQYIQIPDGVALIGEYAFSDCYALRSVSIPDSVAEIGDYAFMRCRSLEQITIPHSTVKLGDYSFFDCPELKEIALGEGINSVGRYAFHGCENLQTVYFEGSAEDWDAIKIQTGNEELTEANIVFDQQIVIQPESISIAGSSYVEVGSSIPVGILFNPTNTTEKQITWTSSNRNAATIDANGSLYGRKVGTTTITAKSSNGLSATMNVRVLFADVPAGGAYYSKPVYWAVDKGITYGFTDADGLARCFGPERSCTRAQMVTFLWRLAGKPNPKSSSSKIKDVKNTSDYYYKAVLWAAEKGITSGYDDGTFRPDATCLREHAVTFLWRYAGKPNASVKNTFTDVKSSDYYYKAVLWAVKNGITNGYSDDNYKTFRPKNNCLREHIVTFMYRY